MTDSTYMALKNNGTLDTWTVAYFFLQYVSDHSFGVADIPLKHAKYPFQYM